MSHEVWATYSVKDHLKPRALAADIMLAPLNDRRLSDEDLLKGTVAFVHAARRHFGWKACAAASPAVEAET